MKSFILSMMLILGISFSQAQTIDTLMVISREKEEPISNSRDQVRVIANDNNQGSDNDTTVIQFNKKRVIIIDDGEDKVVTWDKNDDEDRTRDNNDRWDSDSWKDRDDDDDDDDYERYEWKHNDDDDDDDHKRKRRKTSDVGAFALDLGFTNYYAGDVYGNGAAPMGMDLNQYRFGSHVSMHFLPTTVSLVGRGVVNLKTALTVDYSNFYFQDNITMVPGQDIVTLESSDLTLEKNKLTTRYFQVPMLLNINTNPWTDDGLSVSFGVYGGVLWKAHTKQVSEELGEVKEIDDFNLNPIRYGVMARFDLKWMDVYATYNLTELFEEGQGPSTQTFTVGVNLFDF